MECIVANENCIAIWEKEEKEKDVSRYLVKISNTLKLSIFNFNPLHQLDIKLMKNIFNSDAKTINYFFDLYPNFFLFFDGCY